MPVGAAIVLGAQVAMPRTVDALGVGFLVEPAATS
jgi:hypothetical protein